MTKMGDDGIDVLVLNTAAVDLRLKGEEFNWIDRLVGEGGLAKCKTEDMPPYTQSRIMEWMQQENTATAGGPGNSAPLMARAGLRVAVGVNLGHGDYDGLDAQGRLFYDVHTANNVEVHVSVHRELPTGTTFIHVLPGNERGGIAYFPNANNDFDFENARQLVNRLKPKVVLYMYSGLSDRGDANGGRDLASFVAYCKEEGSIVLVDEHTLVGNPDEVIEKKLPVEAYKLLIPLLAEGQPDIFFTSRTDAQMIANTLDSLRDNPKLSSAIDNHTYNMTFIRLLLGQSLGTDARTRLFGMTVKDGAYYISKPHYIDLATSQRVASRFLTGENIDLVGAGDAFRAGVITYIVHNLDAFKRGTMNFAEAIEMGNLFAALYTNAPLDDRYGNIRPYGTMLHLATNEKVYPTIADIQPDLGPKP